MSFPYTYLRLSITDKCNLNCFYCQPAMRRSFLKEPEVLNSEEVLALSRTLVACGIRHIRLTGGEPLLRPQLACLVKELSQVPGLKILSLTTNGLKLKGALKGLKSARLQKINVSLDTLKKDRFRRLTGSGEFIKVRDAVIAASVSGFSQVKLNIVAMKNFNDDEILDFVDFGSKNKIDVRFIEFFPTHGRCDTSKDIFLSTDEVKRVIEAAYGRLESLGSDAHCGPAQYFKVRGSASRIGFISSVSDFFCKACNRLRLSADGRLYPCLHSGYNVDLKAPLRALDFESVSGLIAQAAENKKIFNKAYCSRSFEMSSIGG